MNGIFTALSTAAVLVCAWHAWRCAQIAHELDHFVTLEERLDAILTRLRKLEGRFNADVRWREPVDDQPGEMGIGQTANACENFALAQREGPNSAAAACQCVYCEGMRAYRRAEKARLLPAARAATLRK